MTFRHGESATSIEKVTFPAKRSHICKLSLGKIVLCLEFYASSLNSQSLFSAVGIYMYISTSTLCDLPYSRWLGRLAICFVKYYRPLTQTVPNLVTDSPAAILRPFDLSKPRANISTEAVAYFCSVE